MARQRRQPVRKHVFHAITRSLCPECRRVVDAQVLIRDGAIYLRKPCPHPDCSACTYAFVDGDQVVPLPRIVTVDDYLDFITNRAAPDLTDEIQQALEALWSMAATMGADRTTTDLACVACGMDLPLPADFDTLKEHFFMVQVHGFMDAHTFDMKRLIKCCIHELLPDGRAVPFCAYNNLRYRQEVHATMGYT